MVTLDKNILKSEYDVVSNDIYHSLFTSTQLVEDYAQWLKTALLKNSFETKAQRTHVIQFLAKLQMQQELIALSQDVQKLKETKKAAVRFARKT
jgi:hypothetical protein